MNQSSPNFFDCLTKFQDLHLRQNVAELILDTTEKPFKLWRRLSWNTWIISSWIWRTTWSGSKPILKTTTFQLTQLKTTQYQKIYCRRASHITTDSRCLMFGSDIMKTMITSMTQTFDDPNTEYKLVHFCMSHKGGFWDAGWTVR